MTSQNLPYVIAIVALVVVVIISIVLVTVFRPSDDNMALFVFIGGFTTSIVVSFLSVIKGNEAVQIAHEVKEKTEETHLSVNSRLDAFIETARQIALAEGRAEGREQGAREANLRTDELKHNPEEG